MEGFVLPLTVPADVLRCFSHAAHHETAPHFLVVTARQESVVERLMAGGGRREVAAGSGLSGSTSALDTREPNRSFGLQQTQHARGTHSAKVM